MRWRLLKLNWAYGIGELVIVVAGVMIALSFDQWNSDRLDRVEEVEIIDRLIADLQVDLEGISGGLVRVARKEALLLRVASSMDSAIERPADMAGFLQDVAGAAAYGWNQARARRTTFDEVLASGKLGLIRDTTIRVRIADYYERDVSTANRINERETAYPDLAFSLVPRRAVFQPVVDLSDEQLAHMVEQVLSSLSPNHVVAETNFAHFVNDRLTDLRGSCVQLTEELEAYRGTIEGER